MKDYFLLAIRNLKRRGLRSWLTLLGIVIGITTVVSLITLGSGLQTAVNSQFGVSSTQVITVQAGGITGYGPPGTGVSNPLNRDDADEIEKISGVEAAIPRNIETISKITYRNIDAPGFAMSLPDEQKELDLGYELLNLKAEKGRLV
ncbi:MAG: ABC transporter permease, partial [Minisyncoccales bacterium]